MDGRIMIGDQILAINGVDVENSSQEEVATLLKVCDFDICQVFQIKWKTSKYKC